MSKVLSVIIAGVVVVGGYLAIHNLKNSVELLPFNENQPQAPLSINPTAQLNHLEGLSPSYISSWNEFSPLSGTFKVLLPSIPQHATELITDPKTKETRNYETFISTDEGGTVFMISRITYPRHFENTKLEDALKNVVHEMLARNKSITLKEMKMSTYGSYQALDYSLVNGDMLVSGKVFIDKNILYILSMINKNDLFIPAEMTFFTNSFSIIKEGK